MPKDYERIYAIAEGAYTGYSEIMARTITAREIPEWEELTDDEQVSFGEIVHQLLEAPLTNEELHHKLTARELTVMPLPYWHHFQLFCDIVRATVRIDNAFEQSAQKVDGMDWYDSLLTDHYCSAYIPQERESE